MSILTFRYWQILLIVASAYIDTNVTLTNTSYFLKACCLNETIKLTKVQRVVDIITCLARSE